MVDRLHNFVLRRRLLLILLTNLILTAVGFYIALGLRFDFDETQYLSVHRLYFPVLLLATFRLMAYMYWSLNSGYWRYASTHDLVSILKAHFASTLLFTAAVLFLRVPGFPRSVIIIEFAISVLIQGGARLVVRLFCERFLVNSLDSHSTGPREVIVLGAGDSGHVLIKNLQSNLRFNYRPIGVLDDNERLQGSQIQGVRVLGKVTELERVLERNPNVSAVIVAIPSLSKSRVEEIDNICRFAGVLLKRLQAFEDIACLDATVPQEKLTIEALLEKEVDVTHEDEIRREIKGKVVFVTGAGGSIGSELVRQIIAFRPKKLVMLDNSEYNLYRIGREMTQHGLSDTCVPALASINDQARLLNIFKTHSPELVFHAAAYKHVPLMESNCYEAFKNNVLGTRNLIKVGHLTAVKRFVMISTDKAVDPSSVMGASKRIAELLVDEYSHEQRDNPEAMATAVVRFGNVINSAGSVIPLFKEQITSGGPLTVTHPDMERYFMSIREAVRLVLTAGTLGQRGEIYMLDMGRPIRIVEVARRMLALYGRRDIPIVFTGTRPGEKLTEELIGGDEQRAPTRFDKVSKVETGRRFAADIDQIVTDLSTTLDRFSDVDLGAALKAIVTSDSTSAPQRPSEASARAN